MAELMDIDVIGTDFDNKENTCLGNVLPCGQGVEKGAEDLDTSEINMKLRYSFTPCVSPMSKSYTNCNKTFNSDISDLAENGNLTRSLDSDFSLNNTVTKPQKLPLTVISSDPSEKSRAETKIPTNNLDITLTGANDSDEVSTPSSSSSSPSTPIPITPTTELLKPEGSPIMRGLRSVFSMFRSSQSPIVPGTDILNQVNKVSEVTTSESPTISDANVPSSNTLHVLASTPITTPTKTENGSKRNSPLKDSIVFKEELTNDLHWNNDSTIIFSKEKIPIHKLFMSPDYLTSSSSCLEDESAVNRNKNLHMSVEPMDISYNDSGIMDKTITHITDIPSMTDNTDSEDAKSIINEETTGNVEATAPSPSIQDHNVVSVIPQEGDISNVHSVDLTSKAEPNLICNLLPREEIHNTCQETLSNVDKPNSEITVSSAEIIQEHISVVFDNSSNSQIKIFDNTCNEISDNVGIKHEITNHESNKIFVSISEAHQQNLIAIQGQIMNDIHTVTMDDTYQVTESLIEDVDKTGIVTDNEDVRVPKCETLNTAEEKNQVEIFTIAADVKESVSDCQRVKDAELGYTETAIVKNTLPAVGKNDNLNSTITLKTKFNELNENKLQDYESAKTTMRESEPFETECSSILVSGQRTMETGEKVIENLNIEFSKPAISTNVELNITKELNDYIINKESELETLPIVMVDFNNIVNKATKGESLIHTEDIKLIDKHEEVKTENVECLINYVNSQVQMNNLENQQTEQLNILSSSLIIHNNTSEPEIVNDLENNTITDNMNNEDKHKSPSVMENNNSYINESISKNEIGENSVALQLNNILSSPIDSNNYDTSDTVNVFGDNLINKESDITSLTPTESVRDKSAKNALNIEVLNSPLDRDDNEIINQNVDNETIIGNNQSLKTNCLPNLSYVEFKYVNEEPPIVLRNSAGVSEPKLFEEIIDNQVTELKSLLPVDDNNVNGFCVESSSNTATEKVINSSIHIKAAEVVKQSDITDLQNNFKVTNNAVISTGCTAVQPIQDKGKNATEDLDGPIEEEVILSESNSPFISVHTEKDGTMTKSLDFDSIDNPFATKSKIVVSPPSSPIPWSPKLDQSFDETENPFVTKSKIRLTPPPNNSFSEEVNTSKAKDQNETGFNNIVCGLNPADALDTTIFLAPELSQPENTQTIETNGHNKVDDIKQEKFAPEQKNVNIVTDIAQTDEIEIPINGSLPIQDKNVSSSEQSLYLSPGNSLEDAVTTSDVNQTVNECVNPLIKIKHLPDSTMFHIEQSDYGESSHISTKELHIVSEDKLEDASNVSEDSKRSTDSEINTEDEDTLEGPFLDVNEFMDFDDAKMDFNPFTDANIPVDEPGEMFIDADAFEFLMNQNGNNIADNGKESLFLKFDPLFAGRGVAAALTHMKDSLCTPKKDIAQTVHNEPSPSDETPPLMETSQDSLDEFNVTVSHKPTMAVLPAVNNETKSKSTTPTRPNRQSVSFNSPAIAVLDRLISLSANNSPAPLDRTVVQDAPANYTGSLQNDAMNTALLQLKQLLSEKQENIHQLQCESIELRTRLSTMETQMKVIEKDNDEKLERINELNCKLSDKSKMNKNMETVVEEYERAIAGLIADTEQEKKQHAEERMKLINERDEQTTHLSHLYVSFSDLHSKFEKSKQVILTYKANEDAYLKSESEFNETLKKMQANYEQLKQHATAKLNHANEELEKMNKMHESEVLKLTAMIKRKELHIKSIEETLVQKTKANEELTAICDELINKVG